MKLLVVRHGAAMERDDFASTGESDDLRPLTDEGKAEMKLIAAGLRSRSRRLKCWPAQQVPWCALGRLQRSSRSLMGSRDTQVTDSLVPGASFDDFVSWCAGLGDKKVVAVVGHEPHLGTLVTWLLAGGNQSRIRLKKGGACLVEFDAHPQRDSGDSQVLAADSHGNSFARNAPIVTPFLHLRKSLIYNSLQDGCSIDSHSISGANPLNLGLVNIRRTKPLACVKNPSFSRVS